MRIHQNDTIAVVVDVQKRLFPFIHEHEQLAETISKFVKGLRILNVPILVTQQYTKALGPTVSQVAEALGEYEAIEKLAFSCCGEPNFMARLNSLNKKYVILAGIETHICVLQTALDLLESGFTPILIEDGVSSRRPNDKHIAVQRMRSDGAVITTYESILFELCKVAGTDQFKAISKLVK